MIDEQGSGSGSGSGNGGGRVSGVGCQRKTQITFVHSIFVQNQYATISYKFDAVILNSEANNFFKITF